MTLACAVIAGRYELHGELATGGTAAVCIGRQIGAAGFVRTVAIKRLHPRYARDPDFLGMFLDEARLVARIRHPHVVQTLDVVAEGNELFLVMDYVHGESLARLLKTSKQAAVAVAPEVILSVVVGALHGLHAAHEATGDTGVPLGIVHRDVSPQNVLVGTDGAARLVDFGVATATERVQTTRDGQLKGKLAYMSPEQLRGEPIDRRTDVYAASVVLWEALTGARLFHADNEGAVVSKVLAADVSPPSALAPGLPRALDAIVMRGLAREREARFATAAEMAAAIEACCIPARLAEVGAWVATTARDALAKRATMIAQVEATNSRRSAEQARDAIHSLRSATPTYPMPIAAASTGSSIPAAAGSQGALTAASSTASTSALSSSAPPPTYTSVQPTPRVARRPWIAPLASLALTACALVAFGGVWGAKRWATRKTDAARIDPSIVATAAPPSASAGAASAPPPVGECPVGMVRIPGGRFFMGSDDDLPNESPAHQVTLGAYCMDELEVTTSQYKACSDDGACKRAPVNVKWAHASDQDRKTYDPLCNARDPDRMGAHPINCVDWEMAERYCRANGKRLPTEAEWEFAARGPDGRRYPWGDDEPSAKLVNACDAECAVWGKKNRADLAPMFAGSDGWATTAPVGSFPEGKSRFGLRDVVGNVWEWTADWYGAYGAEDQANPTGSQAGSERVIRGGAWNTSLATCARPSYRWHDAPDTRSHGVGFRCAK